MVVPIDAALESRIDAAITDVVKEFSPLVKRIRYSLGQNWIGDDAIFFRVLLSDEANDSRKRHDAITRVRSRMMERLDIATLGPWPYLDFRTESEQSALNQPDWAAAS